MAEQVSTTEDINDLYDSLTGTQKCAILMMLLGEDEAAEIMKVSYFNHLPIVDKNFKLKGLHVLEYMKKPMVRKNQVIIMEHL